MAQNSKTLSTDPEEFIGQLRSRINKFGVKEQAEMLEAFEEKWTSGAYTQREKEMVVRQVNEMLDKNYVINTIVYNYAQLFYTIKEEQGKAKINVDDFFNVTNQCIAELKTEQTGKYFKFLFTFVQDGAAFKTSNSAWIFSNPTPKLSFASMEDKELGKTFNVPILTFDNTDLKFASTQDSTIIHDTKGVLNIMNRVWRASSGRLDWTKLGLAADDVYADIKNDYMLNLNYSFVKFDTVLFHYNSLLQGKELHGSYEDINKGHSNVNKANYPYFRSYDGGVVIENFIPNVRYDGGFSLRGVRKIGSAYYVKKAIEKKEGPALKPGEKPVDKPDEEEDGIDWSEFGIKEDDNVNPFWIDGEEDVETQEFWEDEEPDGTADSDDETGGGIFADQDPMFPMFPDSELVLQKATLTIFRNQVPAMRLRAMEFVLDMQKLVSKRTECAVFIGESDSITHPSMEVLYLVDSNEIVLMKDLKDKRARTPYLSPFHNYYMYFDAMKWKTTTDSIRFTAIIDKEHQISAIESKDFYRKKRWDQFKGLLPVHPIGAIYRFDGLNPGIDITPEAILSEHNLMEYLEAFKQELANLEGSGFILYDRANNVIHPLPKLYDWAKAARDRKDYDAIQVLSQVNSGDNARLNLQNKTILMKGVYPFSLSDSQFVEVVPIKSYVEIGENRNLTFGGRVKAGKIDLVGNKEMQFQYQYDNHKILCDSVDSLKFVLDREKTRESEFSPLQRALRSTTIEGVTGAIYINKPNNKNGLEVFPEYSVFDSYTNSYVYWAKEEIHEGVYSKDKLYFSIDPFVLDSLERFDESKLSFEGEFYSSEIFPKIRQKLTVMDDFTLGLKEIAPLDTGYAAYGGKGRFYNEIILDGSGLKGKGKLEYLHTTTLADSFKFFFDSVTAVTKSFTLPGGEREGVWFPDIKANQVEYKWLTKEDKVILKADEKSPIVLFEGEGTFVGELVITPQGLKGNGTITMNNVSITSDELIFQEKDFKATKGTFEVKNQLDPKKTQYKAEEVRIDYDVNSHHSTFQSVEMGKANSSFPQQKYKTSLGSGTYDRKTNDLYLDALSPKKKENYFYSTDPKQDSLAFLGQKAYYNFDKEEIEIDQVDTILVADAKVIPDQNKVTIQQSGMMRKLDNAVVQANVETNYHRMYGAQIEVMGRKDYKGTGKYDYIPVNDKEQYIEFTEISVKHDTSEWGNTIAKGTIPEEQGFYLTERIFFKGETQLSARDKYMRFKGQVKIDSENEFLNAWFDFEDEVNPDSVFIEIDPSKLGKLVVGLHYIPRYRAFYSTFLQPKKENTDKDMALATGGLTFDRNTKEFRIGPEDKLNGKQYRGTTSSINDKTNVITTQGKFDFPYNFVRNTMELEMAGSWRDDINNAETTAELAMAIDWKIVPKEAWAKLAEKFQLQTSGNENLPFSNQLVTYSLAEFLDKGKSEEKTQAFVKAVQNSIIYNDIKVAKDLPYSWVLTNMRFKYDAETKSLYLAGDVGVVGINGTVINKMSSTNTKIEYNIGKTTPTGVQLSDTLRMFIEADQFTWVYFEYYDDVLNTISSDVEGYNAILAAEIAKRKKNEGYRFNLLTDYEKEEFITRFIRRYFWRDIDGGNNRNNGGNSNGGNDNGGNDNGSNGNNAPNNDNNGGNNGNNSNANPGNNGNNTPDEDDLDIDAPGTDDDDGGN